MYCKTGVLFMNTAQRTSFLWGRQGDHILGDSHSSGTPNLSGISSETPTGWFLFLFSLYDPLKKQGSLCLPSRVSVLSASRTSWGGGHTGREPVPRLHYADCNWTLKYGEGISLSFMACRNKLSPELLHRKKQYFNVSGLVNAIGSLTANLTQTAF